jgi:AraC-like DNA-binding protein
MEVSMIEGSRNPAVYDGAHDSWPAGEFSNIDVCRALPKRPRPEPHAAHEIGGRSPCLPVLRRDAVLIVLHIRDFRSCRLWIDGSAEPVDLTFGPGEPGAALALSRPGASGRWLHFHVPRHGASDTPLRQESRSDPLPYPPSVRISDAVDHRLGECLIKAMRLAVSTDEPLHRHLLKTLLECLLLSLNGYVPRIAAASAPVPPQRGGLAPWQVRRVQQIMDEKLEEAVAIDELAAACRLSKSHFARAFKVTTGQSPHRWHLAHRVERAKCLMIESDQSLADIALVCGFADQSHFAKVFSRFVGLPPGTWRRAQERALPSDIRMANDNVRMGVVAYGSAAS